VKRVGYFLLIALLTAFVWHFVDSGVVWQLVDAELTATQKVSALRSYFQSFGVAAPLAYVAFVTVEVVVAPIPGAMLYAPGGTIFGGFWGGLLALTGNVLGASIACCLFRSLGQKTWERVVERQSLTLIKSRIDERGAWIVFLLRVNPLTSTDLVSYAAGLTNIPVWKVMAATLAGMTPLCFAQAYLAENVIMAYPWLIYPLATLCVIYLIVALFVIRRLGRKVGVHPTNETAVQG